EVGGEEGRGGEGVAALQKVVVSGILCASAQRQGATHERRREQREQQDELEADHGVTPFWTSLAFGSLRVTPFRTSLAFGSLRETCMVTLSLDCGYPAARLGARRSHPGDRHRPSASRRRSA